MTVDQSEYLRQLAIVDDDEQFRSFVRRAAERLGWSVLEFSNGKELFAALTSLHPPDLILLDMVMPELDGIETIGALSASSLRCRIILVTGRLPIYTETASELARFNGIDIVDVLQKPVRLDRLRAVLDPARVIGHE